MSSSLPPAAVPRGDTAEVELRSAWRGLDSSDKKL